MNSFLGNIWRLFTGHTGSGRVSLVVLSEAATFMESKKEEKKD